jgi:glyoxylase-like metal-dependent hydrolase (beta-lactamase superfamily II)
MLCANLANNGQAMMDKIRTFTDKPVKTIIITHPHADHIGSIEFFGRNIQTVAQDPKLGILEARASKKS